MINTRWNETKKTPIWATLGAPLLGIPLLVGLLSLAAPEPALDDAGSWSSVEGAPVVLTETGAEETALDVELEAVFVTEDDAVDCEGEAGETETRES